ncbi:hypothetical protein RU97_GL002664 [Enterococcus canis]|uniref:Endolytic murein transglycosylase n=1 Tax=Enterococcus canis TaxID=214095 RepID=A0A1L8RCM4_9ENTE|nr:endolytic transglycosylase MltG [Enterococcus canis]OJG17493.1 hypothetical protein RU97_GL002664 [Enterococcus canis]
MANDNQDNQHSEESLRDKVLRSLKQPDEEQKSATPETPAEETQQPPLSEPTEETFSRRSYQNSQKTKEPKEPETPIEPLSESEEETEMPATGGRRDLKNNRQKEDRIVTRIVLIVVTVLIVIAGVLGFSVYRYVTSSLEPLDPKNDATVQVEIPIGSSNKQIGNILEEDKVIKSGLIFNYYAKFKNWSGFQAGYYNLAADMTLDDIAAKLQEGGTAEPQAPVSGKVTIPEGLAIEDVANSITVNQIDDKKEKTPFKKDDFIALMKDDTFFDKMLEKYPTLLDSASKASGVRYRLEGYLFPATYEYNETTTVESLAEQMVKAMDDNLKPYYDQIKEKDLTIQQVLTLASLVEREGVTEGDRRNIAQVFFNRLAIDMPLQSDISVLYALGEHKELLTIEDTMVDSPYNLYQNPGYGPGPFDNPSLQSIQAVLNPEKNDYLYFVADIDTGKVYYAETYEEHQVLVDKYVNSRNQ